MLTGKKVDVTPYITENYEAFEGGTTPKDVETALQLIYLYLQIHVRTRILSASDMARENSFIQNMALSPEAVLRDSNQAVVNNHHFRKRPLTAELLKEIKENDVMNLYKQRFADGGNFTFFFVGNFKPEDIKPLIETYIASRPLTGKREMGRYALYFPKVC